eukprot:TRINITY_DN1547_c0_g1_i2.p1 TRINITY_DN1547_c0_g1~~TRINITY_DN1547_c0_g1_i2.p1  ORF type:complete len:151 (+),score=28.04 TRINITY_DN1547_c0_g1_i2:200-652(+)
MIEKCLQLYMHPDEVFGNLERENIPSDFTRWVWAKLEEQNPKFFLAYNIRLRIKEQISAFNYLVSQQAQLMHKSGLLASKGPTLEPPVIAVDNSITVEGAVPETTPTKPNEKTRGKKRSLAQNQTLPSKKSTKRKTSRTTNSREYQCSGC